MLAGPGTQEEQVRPDPAGARFTRRADHIFQLLGPVRDARQDGSHADARLDARVHERLESAEALARMRGAGLGPAPDLLVDGRDRERDRDRSAACRLGQDVDVADDQRTARDDAEGVRVVAQRLDAAARQAIAALGWLVGIGRGADRDRLMLPGRLRELTSEHLDDVGLDANRGPVAVVERPVRTQLEGAHVTERALVDAAHVRVQGPVERHPLDPVERHLARLLAILRAHGGSIEHTFVMQELRGGIRRLTFPLPMGIRHVHCYLLPGDDGWTLVDTGLGLPAAEELWAPVLAELDRPIARIVVTHFHPDHAGGGEDARALTGAPVLQGVLDYEQCERVWGSADWSERLADYLQANGLPEAVAAELRHESTAFGPFIRFARDPEPL